MAEHRNIKTKKEDIIKYWIQYVDECDLSVDWSEADTHCWRCGCERKLERCHIVPHALGGRDEPSNLVLLCASCHAEGPNVTDPEIMWDWIKAYKQPFYETFWIVKGLEEYEFIYKTSLLDDIKQIVIQSGIADWEAEAKIAIDRVMDSVYEEASIHFGQPYLNTATIAGIYRMMVKKIAEEMGVYK